jgi:hypothetical protein
MALILTSDQSLTDNTGFPFISEFGIIGDEELASYLDRMDTAGHEWAHEEVSALVTSVDAVKTAGLWDDIVEIYPLFGDTAEAAQEPLFARLTSNAKLDMALGSWGAIEDVVDGVRVGIIGSDTNIVRSGLSQLLQYQKTGYTNPNTFAFGFARYFQAVSDTIIRTGFGAQREGSTEIFDRVFMLSADSTIAGESIFVRTTPATNVAKAGARYYHSNSTGATGLTAVGDLAATLTGVTGSITSPHLHPNEVARPLLRHGLNGTLRYTDAGVYSATSSSSATFKLRWYLAHNGTLSTDAKVNALRAATAPLIAALGKTFT